MSDKVRWGKGGGQLITGKMWAGGGGQAPAVYRKIPVYRDWTQIPIPGFLKIEYRYFSGFFVWHVCPQIACPRRCKDTLVSSSCDKSDAVSSSHSYVLNT